VPSQDGETPRRPESIETFDSAFHDGVEPDVAPTPVAGEQTPRGDPALNPDERAAERPSGAPSGASVARRCRSGDLR